MDTFGHLGVMPCGHHRPPTRAERIELRRLACVTGGGWRGWAVQFNHGRDQVLRTLADVAELRRGIAGDPQGVRFFRLPCIASARRKIAFVRDTRLRPHGSVHWPHLPG